MRNSKFGPRRLSLPQCTFELCVSIGIPSSTPELRGVSSGVNHIFLLCPSHRLLDSFLRFLQCGQSSAVPLSEGTQVLRRKSMFNRGWSVAEDCIHKCWRQPRYCRACARVLEGWTLRKSTFATSTLDTPSTP